MMIKIFFMYKISMKVFLRLHSRENQNLWKTCQVYMIRIKLDYFFAYLKWYKSL